MIRVTLLFAFLLFGFSHQGEAKFFKNSYIQFQMPEKWACELTKKAYLCRHRVSKTCKQNPNTKECKEQIKKSREAVIVMSAKPKSKVDNLGAFQKHFGEAKKLKASEIATSQSKVIHNKRVKISKLPWVDAMHLGSEIPHYYTRYLSTINGDVAVLVSFTAHKMFYTNYSNEFFKGIKSLKVTATEISQVKNQELGTKVLSHPIDIPDELFSTPAQTPSGDGFSTLLFALAMILAGIGIYIWLKRKK